MRQALERVRGAHHRFHLRQVHLRRDAGNVVHLVFLVNLQRQIAQANALVMGMLLNEFRHYPPERLIAVEIHLELLQLGDEGVPSTLRNADGKHHQERIKASLLDDNAVLGEVFRDDGRRHAPRGKTSIDIKARSDDGRLDRIQHVEALLQLAKAVPAITGFQEPVLALANAVLGQILRAPDLEPPILAEFGVDLPHRTPEFERLVDRFLHQRHATGGVHHRRGDIA